MAEEKLSSVSQPGEERTEVEGSLKETQAIQNEISRKKPELAVLLSNVQVNTCREWTVTK